MLNIKGETFAPNASKYFDEDPSLGSDQTSIHVEIIIQGETEINTIARLDPATPWVVLDGELTDSLGISADGPDTYLQTAAGRMKGTLKRYPIVLAAQQGSPLEIEATLFVCSEWQRGNFLGYSGLLERIRFAIDPASHTFYFGPA